MESKSLADQAYILTQQLDATYAGPCTLGLLALSYTDPAKKRQTLKEGEAILVQECVSHNYLHFYQYAMEVSLKLGDWDEVKRYADKLEAYTSQEPLPWSDYFIACGLCLAHVGDGTSGPEYDLEVERLRKEGEQVGLFPSYHSILA